MTPTRTAVSVIAAAITEDDLSDHDMTTAEVGGLVALRLIEAGYSIVPTEDVAPKEHL